MDVHRSIHISCLQADSGISTLLLTVSSRHGSFHFQAGFTDRDTIFANGKIIFVLYLNATFFIKVNEWDNPIFTAVKIVRNGIMCRIQKPFFNRKIRKKRFHPEVSFQKAMGIMFGSTITNTVFSFSCRSYDRCSVAGNGKGGRIDEAFVNGRA